MRIHLELFGLAVGVVGVAAIVDGDNSGEDQVVYLKLREASSNLIGIEQEVRQICMMSAIKLDSSKL